MRDWRRTLESILLSLAAIGVGLLLFGGFCGAVGAHPLGVYQSIWRAAFADWSRLQTTLVRAAPLMLSSLCTALPARLGLVIIGNEGALVMGGLAATVVGLALSYGTVLPTPAQIASPLGIPSWVVQVGMGLVAMVVGGGWIMMVGALRHYRGVNETISSLLMNYLAIALLNHLVGGPIRDPGSLNKPSSFALPSMYWLGSIPGTRVHWGLVYGLVACGIAYVLIQRTTFGFATRVVGGNLRAARIAGLPVGKLTLIVTFLAGSCAGLAGMVEVAAVQGAANESLNAGYGYGGILVAFASRHNPLAGVLISLLVGGIVASGGILQRQHGLPDATVLIFEGLIFLCVLYSDSFYGQLPWFQDRPAVAAPPPGNSEQKPLVT